MGGDSKKLPIVPSLGISFSRYNILKPIYHVVKNKKHFERIIMRY
jgi:hypothetical protein